MCKIFLKNGYEKEIIALKNNSVSKQIIPADILIIRGDSEQLNSLTVMDWECIYHIYLPNFIYLFSELSTQTLITINKVFMANSKTSSTFFVYDYYRIPSEIYDGFEKQIAQDVALRKCNFIPIYEENMIEKQQATLIFQPSRKLFYSNKFSIVEAKNKELCRCKHELMDRALDEFKENVVDNKSISNVDTIWIIRTQEDLDRELSTMMKKKPKNIISYIEIPEKIKGIIHGVFNPKIYDQFTDYDRKRIDSILSKSVDKVLEYAQFSIISDQFKAFVSETEAYLFILTNVSDDERALELLGFSNIKSIRLLNEKYSRISVALPRKHKIFNVEIVSRRLNRLYNKALLNHIAEVVAKKKIDERLNKNYDNKKGEQ